MKLSFALPVGADPHRRAGIPEEEAEGLGCPTERVQLSLACISARGENTTITAIN